MKKWYVCQYDRYHVQNPHGCKPVGIIYQQQEGDQKDRGGTTVHDFETYLQKHDLCAFGESYAPILSKYTDLSSLRTIKV